MALADEQYEKCGSGKNVVRVGRAFLCVPLVWAAVVGGCQPLPRPFQPEDKAASLDGHLEPGPWAGLAVAGPSGLSRPHSERLAALVAAALRDLGVAATVATSERRRYRLRGRIDRETDPPAAPTVVLRWSLVDPEGEVVGTVTQREILAPPAGRDLAEATLASLAARAAPRIERMLGVHGETPAPPRRPFGPVVVYRVDGAPGDGATALRREMRRALRARGVTVVDDIADDAYVVLGAVHIDKDQAPPGWTVEIDWTVLRLDGHRVGSVHQRNSVAAGRLDGAWGTIATAAADGGADGLASLLETVRTDRRETPGGR